jgi:NADH-quinone oxidoreductase subunit E
VRGTAADTVAPADVVDVAPPQEATPGPVGRAANVSAQSASVPVGHEAGPAAVAERDAEAGTDDDTGAIDAPDADGSDGKGE